MNKIVGVLVFILIHGIAGTVSFARADTDEQWKRFILCSSQTRANGLHGADQTVIFKNCLHSTAVNPSVTCAQIRKVIVGLQAVLRDQESPGVRLRVIVNGQPATVKLNEDIEQLTSILNRQGCK